MPTNKIMKLLFFGIFIFVYFNIVSAANLATSLKMAQCRAHCLNKFGSDLLTQDDAMCKGNSNCSMCWQTCEKLSTDYPIWSFNCGQERRCNAGCESACEFLSIHKDSVVPLSPYKSRLTLIFGGTSAQWSLIWGAEVPSQRAVFALFTRSSVRPWKLRVQTADYGALLQDVVTGTELKLVAVAESGLLSVIITPFEPPSHYRKGLVGFDGQSLFLPEEEYPWNKDNVVSGDQEGGWPLLHEAYVQDSGLVAARVWWSAQSPIGSDYLVTWEVAGGGLKGHLYTDIPEVDLKLWPKTVYKVQVEVVSGPLKEPRVSQLLILDTHNITAVELYLKDDIFEEEQEEVEEEVLEEVNEPYQPLVKPFDAKIPLEVLVGCVLGVVAAVAAVTALVYRTRTTSRSTFNDSSSSNSKLTLNRSLPDLTMDENLVRCGKGALLTESPKSHERHCGHSVYSVPYPALNPQNTLGIPNSQNHYININSLPFRNNVKPNISII